MPPVSYILIAEPVYVNALYFKKFLETPKIRPKKKTKIIFYQEKQSGLKRKENKKINLLIDNQYTCRPDWKVCNMKIRIHKLHKT